MSVSTLQPATPSNVQRSSINAEGKEAGFLTFNYLNKHARVRVSPQPLDPSGVPGRANFLVVSNSYGWFAAITRSATNDLQLSCSSLSHLQRAFASSPPAGVEEISFEPQRTLTISGTPNLLSLACNDTKLLIAFTHGPISVYDCSQIFTPGTNEVSPIHTFPGNLPSQQIEPNPGDMPDLVAVLREGDNPPVQVLNARTFQPVCGWNAGGTPETTPCALSWSPRGKQLAIALQSGDIVTYSPTASDSPKTTISRPPGVVGNRVLSATWLANPTFFTVYAPVGPLEPKMPQSHYVVNFDSKSNVATDISLSAPYFPFPGLRNPGAFVLVFRNWDPVKFLLVIGDGTSQDIGSIGCYAEASGEVWYNLNVDEAYAPSLPLDKDMNDTILLGLDLDLTATGKYDHLSTSGEKVEVPPPPIMYAYSSDGTFIGWYVVNGTAKMYPGMKNVAGEPSVDAPMSVTPAASIMNETTPSGFGVTQLSTGFGGPGNPPQPTFGSTGFGQSSSTRPTFSTGTTTGGFAGFANGGNTYGFSQPSFGQTGFGESPQPPAFGQQTSAFGQTQTPSVFGQSQTPAFGQTNQSSVFGQADQSSSFLKPPSLGQPSFGQTSAFGSSGSSGGGFGAFANNNSTPGDTQAGPKSSEMIREVSMGIDSGSGGFGGLSLGDGGESGSTQGKGLGGLFGGAVTQPPSTSTTPTFGSSTISPGFGAFSNWNQAKLDTPSPSNPQQDTSKLASGFGQTGFGTKSTPAFGQPAFGSTSTFGQTSLGTPTSSASPVTPSTGGFGAWSGSTSSLLTPGTSTSTKPAWSSDKDNSQVESKAEPTPVFTPPGKSDLTTIRDQPKRDPSTPSKSQQEVTTPSPTSSPESPQPPITLGTTSSLPLEQSPSPPPFGKPTMDKTPPIGGAFANLKQSTFSLGDSVFGAPDKSSPFFKPVQPTPTTTPAKVSAFGIPVTASPAPSTSTPVFGRSSVFGHTTPSTTPKTPAIPSPTTGGFSAFASTTSPFGKVDGTGKSFSDLLKTPDKAEEPTKPTQRPSVFSLPNLPDKEEPPKTPTKVSPTTSTVFSLANLTPPPDLGSLGLGTPSSDIEHPSGDEYSEDGSSQQSGEEGEDRGEDREEEDGEDTEEYGSDSESGSFLDESLSYEDLGAHLDEEEIEGPHELSPVAEETTLPLESGDEGDTTQSPRKKRPTPDPTKVALPASRESSVQPDSKSSSGSPSVTPRPTDAKLPSPEATSVQQSREPSTTPPSTPAKLSPTLPTPSTSSYGIGLGRPSARPTRSSPLTSDTVSGRDSPKQPLSAVAPLLPKPRPASPKVAFGQWNTLESQKRPDLSKIQPFSLGTVPSKVTSEPAKTPLFGALSTLGKTPPPFGKPGESPAPSLGTVSTPPQPTLGSELSGEQEDIPTRAPPNNLFGKHFAPPRSTPGGLFNDPTGGTVGRSTTESFLPPNEATRTPELSHRPPSLPPTTPGSDTGVKSVFFSIANRQSPVTPPVATPPKTAQSPIPEPSPADGLQAECQYLYLSMNKDIEELKGAAQKMPQRRADLLKPKANSPQPPPGISKNGLEDAQKWSLPDVPAYGKAMKSLHADITALKESWGPFHQVLGEIEGDMLKASTRREEITRFSKAINNPDFARMLKTRNLGPEHLEKQTRLRKQVRSIRDRVEKLESHLQAAKKKLEREKSGKVGFKAPTLDTINRTYRNIDIAIARQMEDINKLSSRMSRLDLKSFQKSKPSTMRDKRLPDRSSKGGKAINITSSIAATAATTLNAERSAYKLKKVLLSIRDKPLLNAKASTTASTRVEFKTPQKLSGGLSDSTGGVPTTPLPRLPAVFPTTTSPSPLSISGGNRRAKHHAKSAWSSKKPEAESSPSPALATFDWGPPLPTVSGQKPSPSLPFSLLPSTPPPGSNNKSPGLPFALR